jgi:predicted transposase YbfD/YdcC
MLQEHFETLTDTRQRAKIRHNLLEIVVMTICAVTIGCEYWYQIHHYCRHQAQWFRDKLGLTLAHGVASSDTFRRAFAAIDPKEFERHFIAWVKTICKATEKEIVSIDGKTLCGSKDNTKSPLHLVSAWASKNRLVLGQLATESKSNEITAIPNLLDILELNDCIVTIDAMGTQRDIASKIVKNGNDYVLAVKENQPKLHEFVWKYFDECLCDEKLYFAGNTVKTAEKGHGRIEKRKYCISTDIDWLEQKPDWAGINAIGMVESTVERNGKVSTERRYYITTLTDVKTFATAVRAHWGIENGLHWCLDVVFREDKCRTRKDNAAENFAVVRHMVLNILKNYPTEKPSSLNAKRLRCQYDFDFLSAVLLSVFT